MAGATGRSMCCDNMARRGSVNKGGRLVQYTVNRTIQASVDSVFGVISDIKIFAKVMPDVQRVEFLTPETAGVGTKFRETRLMGNREASTVLEVRECVENRLIRFVSDEGGTIWDTVMTVKSEGEQTLLSMTMHAQPYKLMSRISIVFIQGMLMKHLERDMDAVKGYCEQLDVS